MLKISKSFKKRYFTPVNMIFGIILLGIILVFSIVFVQKLFSGKADAPITKDQIMVKKGDEIVIINRNGLIEYRSKDKVFYQTWDSTKISAFFTSIEERVRRALDNPPSVSTDCYQVTMYLDGKLVTVCVSDDIEDLEEIFEEFGGGEYDDTTISDLFDDEDGGNGQTDGDGDGDDDEDEDDDSQGDQPTPTPTSQPGNGGGSTNYPPVKAGCEYWGQLVVGDKAIISNTLCTFEDD